MGLAHPDTYLRCSNEEVDEDDGEAGGSTSIGRDEVTG